MTAFDDLLTAYKQAHDESLEATSAFLDTLKSNSDADSVIELCLQILENWDELGGVLAAMKAAGELVDRRDPAVLDRVKALQLPAVEGGFRDYRVDIAYLIAILEHAATGTPDNCDIYAYGTHNVSPYFKDELTPISCPDDPKAESVGYPGNSRVECYHCSICGRNWAITVDDTYHYPHFYWRAV